MNENDILSAEELIKPSKNIINNTYKYHFNYYSPKYNNDINPSPYEFNYNDDIHQFNTSPKIFPTKSNYKKLNNIFPHNHYHLPYEHRHIHHTPQCRSHSSSPSPIKNISQPLYNTYYNSNMNEPKNNSQIFFSDDLSNDLSNNNNLIQKIDENDIDNNKKEENNNHFKAMIFDDYMNKLVNNKYNKMKQFDESYYLRKQFGDETNYTNINNTFNDVSIKEEFDTMRNNLEKKYKLYNLLTKYDNIELKNNFDENENKINEDEAIKEKEKKKNHKKNNRKKRHKKNISSSSEDSDFDSSPEKNNFIKDEKNNKNIIQKTFNENIGQKNSTYVSSTYNHVKEKDNKPNNEPNINNSNLLEYLKKENEELKNTNNNYKQTLDTLFYFLNNIFHKYKKEEGENQKNDIFDLSKDITSIENLSKKLINLEALINTNDRKDKIKPLLIMTKENSLQLPDSTKLEKFNDLIEGINEKCFSFKEDNYIERYKNDKNIFNNEINNINKISEINTDQNINKEFVNKIINENDKDKCIACLLGCNISKRGYSPMRYNPNNKKEKEKRKDDSGDLLDIFNEKEKKNKSKDKRNINRVSKSKDNSLDNSNNNRRNSKSTKTRKKIWK